MNTAEVDLDRLVDYEREYGSVVKRAQVTGDHMIGLCPFHDDSKNSFSVDLKTGRWHCFSEDIGGNYVDFVAKMNGISTKDAYDGYQITVPLPEPTKEISVIEHQCSYGSIMNLLEIWADGSIQGYLSAKQTLRIIERVKARESPRQQARKSKKRREMRCRKSTKNWRTIDQY